MVRKIPLSILKLVALIASGALAIAGLTALIAPAGQSLGHVIDAQPLDLPTMAKITQRSYVYDAHGNQIAQLYSDEDRSPVALKQIPDRVIATILAVEDRNFYKHKGVDYRGLVRAFLKDVSTGSREGGSSITQQLAKNTLFPGGRSPTGREKLKEYAYAGQLEKRLSKAEILQSYLNTIYFGNGAYGIKVASERYFNKPTMRDLTTPEVALLAGLIAKPSGADPLKHPVAARQRRAEVFDSLVAVGLITPADAARFDAAPLPKQTYSSGAYAPNGYFMDAMLKWIVKDNAAGASLGPDVATRRARIFHDGLRITTTWDQEVQAKLDAAVASEPLPDQVSAAAVTIDNDTGQVKAFHSQNEPWNEGKRRGNIAVDGDGRQPGSQFKVFTLAEALNSGYSPDDTISGSEATFFPPISTDATGWKPKTDRSGSMSLRTALAVSVNPAFARLEFSLGQGTAGPQRVAEMAHRMGVSRDRKLALQSSLTLGVSGVLPLDMASAFSTIANEGVHHDPVFVTKIVDAAGNVLYDESASGGVSVFSPQVARSLTDIMQDVVKKGTAKRAKLNDKRMVAGKTGTTNGSSDLWFTGFTTQYTTSVWIGNQNSGTFPLEKLLGRGEAQGGRIPTRIFAAFMNAVHVGLPIVDFTPPDEKLWPRRTRIDENGRQTPRPHAPVYVPVAPTTIAGSTSPTTPTPGGKPVGPKSTTPTTKKP